MRGESTLCLHFRLKIIMITGIKHSFKNVTIWVINIISATKCDDLGDKYHICHKMWDDLGDKYHICHKIEFQRLAPAQIFNSTNYRTCFRTNLPVQSNLDIQWLTVIWDVHLKQCWLQMIYIYQSPTTTYLWILMRIFLKLFEYPTITTQCTLLQNDDAHQPYPTTVLSTPQ